VPWLDETPRIREIFLLSVPGHVCKMPIPPPPLPGPALSVERLGEVLSRRMPVGPQGFWRD